MTRRFWIGASLALPVFVLAMAHLIPALGRLSWVDGNVSRWIAICARHACDLVGRLAFITPWLALLGHASSEHVHADLHRRGRGIHL